MPFPYPRAALAALFVALPLAASAHDGVHVHDAFAIISPAGSSGAAFMLIDNHGAADDRLVAARSDVARRVELHTHIEDDQGVMRMVEVEEGFAIPSGGERLLERGGDHVMFLGLTRELAEGDSVEVTLVFEQEGEITLEIPVRAPGMGGHSHGHAHDHSHGHSHGD